MINNILLPVDGSEYAKRAVLFACGLVQKFDANLTLIHVMHHHGSARVPPELREYNKLEHMEVTEQDFLQGTADQILNDAEQLAYEQNANVTAKLSRVGDPGYEIAQYANDNSVDLIVLGCRGLGNVSGLLLGSVSHKVSHLADCSCVLVK